MKKILSLMLAAMLVLGLAACGDAGSTETPAPTAAPSETAPEDTTSPTEAVEDTTSPTEAVEGTAAPEDGENGGDASLLETAKTFEGAPVEDLIAAIGEPESSDYAPSCLGEGEDGNLYYDGFTVYTYRDTDGQETVNYVE